MGIKPTVQILTGLTPGWKHRCFLILKLKDEQRENNEIRDNGKKYADLLFDLLYKEITDMGRNFIDWDDDKNELHNSLELKRTTLRFLA